MGDLADRLSTLRVTATSPDGGITATVSGGHQLNVTFRAGAYRGYRDSQLGHQLARLTTLTWITHERESRRILGAKIDSPTDDATRYDTQSRRFRERAERVVTEATSANGSIHLSTRALLDWQVVLAAGTVDCYGAGSFLAEFSTARSPRSCAGTARH